MSWYLIVFLTATVGDLQQGFMWYNPKFENKEKCIDWANNNPVPIIQTLNYYYDDWELRNMVCVREDRLEDINMQPYVEGDST